MNMPPTNCHVLSPQAARVLARYRGVKLAFGSFLVVEDPSFLVVEDPSFFVTTVSSWFMWSDIP